MKINLTVNTPVSLHPQRTVTAHNKPALKYSRTEPIGPVVRISFKGNSEKNYRQFASIAAEDKGIGLPEYNRGGLAAVAYEAPESWHKHLGADVRSFSPYHCYDNPTGKIKVLMIPKDEKGNKIPTANPTDFRVVPTDYALQEGESFVIQSAPTGGKSKYVELERLDISGSVKRLSETELTQVEVPYQLFQVKNDADGVTRYIVHTQDLAKLPQSYGSGDTYSTYGAYGGTGNTGGAYGGAKNVYGGTTNAYGGTGNAYGGTKNVYGAYGGCTDLAYTDNDKAVIDILPKLNQEKYGNFNPANIWLHDRTAFPAMLEVTDRSADGNKYFRGLRIGATYHNPGRTYQGAYNNPFEFLRIIANQKDIEELQKHPDYQFLKNADKAFREGTATAEDIAKANKILKPFLEHFTDDLGSYNMTMIPVRGTHVNPYNIISGTVSRNYGKEMKNHNTYSIADGLTSKFASTITVNITNGSTPANLKLDNPNADFGKGGNGLSEQKAGFKTYKPVIENNTVKNIDEILEAKKQNAKWLLDLIGNADTKSDPEALQKLFFNSEAINPKDGKKPSTVLGQLSPYKDGDMLFMGWGRPDPQKGFPTSFEGFWKFLQDPSVPEETKLHTKLLIGAGSDTWPEDARDWINIQNLIKEIQKLDGGKYKGNVMYVNGLFPNRLVGCAYNSIFTSVFEPCGITPLESYVAGTPCISVKTGGAPDFIVSYDSTKNIVTNETGFLTSGPYLRNPEDLVGLTKEKLAGTSSDKLFGIIDDQRRAMSSDDIAKCFKRATSLDHENYKKMTINCFLQRVDWHENSAYNGTLSANARYMKEFWHLNENLTPISGLERNTNPLKRLAGNFGEALEQIQETGRNIAKKAVNNSKTGKNKIVAFAAIGAAVIGSAVYYIKNNQNKKAPQQSPQKTEITAASIWTNPAAQNKLFSKIA